MSCLKLIKSTYPYGANVWAYNRWMEYLNVIFLFAAAKSEMVKSKLPNSVLSKVWKLADVDKDGMLDEEEFALAMHLINIKIDGNDLPAELPTHLVPPSKRWLFYCIYRPQVLFIIRFVPVMSTMYKHIHTAYFSQFQEIYVYRHKI